MAEDDMKTPEGAKDFVAPETGEQEKIKDIAEMTKEERYTFDAEWEIQYAKFIRGAGAVVDRGPRDASQITKRAAESPDPQSAMELAQHAISMVEKAQEQSVIKRSELERARSETQKHMEEQHKEWIDSLKDSEVAKGNFSKLRAMGGAEYRRRIVELANKLVSLQNDVNAAWQAKGLEPLDDRMAFSEYQAPGEPMQDAIRAKFISSESLGSEWIAFELPQEGTDKTLGFNWLDMGRILADLTPEDRELLDMIAEQAVIGATLQDVETREEEIDNAESDLNFLREELRDAEEDISNVEKEISEAEGREEKEDLKQELEDLKEEKKGLEEQISASQTEISDEDEELEEHRSIIKSHRQWLEYSGIDPDDPKIFEDEEYHRPEMTIL